MPNATEQQLQPHNPKFTPGPWHISMSQTRIGPVLSVETSVIEHVCTLEDRWNTSDKQRRNADAKLISSAPELLSEIIQFHDQAIDQGWHDCEGIPGGCTVLAVINKAQGI